MQIRGWKVQRSGAGMRITGFDKSTQKDVKVQVVRVEPRRGGLVIATDKDGTEHELSPE
jgi:hypothetical protein